MYNARGNNETISITRLLLINIDEAVFTVRPRFPAASIHAARISVSVGWSVVGRPRSAECGRQLVTSAIIIEGDHSMQTHKSQ